MGSISKKAKIDVTVNGSGFDDPSQVTIVEEGEIPTCQLTFPGGSNSRYKITRKDKIRVYVGLDDVPDYPTFVGHQADEFGFTTTRMELIGSLNRGIDDKRFVTDFDNFDGQEISTAIATVFGEISELSWMSSFIEATNPTAKVPDGLRYENGVSKYDLLKQFRDLAVDPEDPLLMRRYTFFQHGDQFQFRKIPLINSTTEWYETFYGDSLLGIDPQATSRFSFNKSRVKGKDGVLGEFQNDHRVNVDGLVEADILVDNEILSAGEAYEVARAGVLQNMQRQNGLEIRSFLLLEAIPNLTVIRIRDAPYGLSDRYLIQAKEISVAPGMFDVTAKVTTPVDVLSEVLSQLLSLNRDFVTVA